MNESNPKEGISPSGKPTPPAIPKDGIAPGEAPKPAGPAMKPYEMHDDAPMPSLAGRGSADDSDMASLAQSARGKQINSARWALLIIGVVTILANAYVLATNRTNVEKILKERGIQQVPADIERLLTMEHYLTIMFIGMGVVFIVLGIIVKMLPVLCTSLGFALYTIGVVISGVMNPESIAQGLIVKIVIVVVLFKAIQAARAYEGAQRQAATPDY